MAKRRPNSDGMVRKRADGRWEGRIVASHKENGKPIFRSVFAKTQKELLPKLNQLRESYLSVEQNMILFDEQYNEFSAIKNITFIGYPSGLYDEINKLSIIRQGITATPIRNNFKGEDIFLIDAGAFSGSSDSPVFIYNQGAYPTKDGIVLGN